MTPNPDDSDAVDPHQTRHQFLTVFGEVRAPGWQDDRAPSPPTEAGSWSPPPGPRPPYTTPETTRGTGGPPTGRPHPGSSPIEVGQVLYGKYLVQRRLGSGAMGDVWLVRHQSLNRDHALKVIVPHLASHQGAMVRFQREFHAMASFHHEHAVQVYDARLDNEGGYIDMEYVEGLTIHDVLVAARSAPGRDQSAPLMPFDWTLRVLRQLCEVLDLAHQKGIVHRDLKPSNLMLLAHRPLGLEFLKVLDFGIAKIRHDPENKLNEATLTGGFIGTPSYSSPEQVDSRAIDGRSDLYSVGVLLYEIACGRLPFLGNPYQVMVQQAQKEPPPFAEANPALKVAPEIEGVILRLLSKDPEGRPASARALYDEFYRAVVAYLPQDSAGDDHGVISPSATWERVPYRPPTVPSTEAEPVVAAGEATVADAPAGEARTSPTSRTTWKLPPATEAEPNARTGHRPWPVRASRLAWPIALVASVGLLATTYHFGKAGGKSGPGIAGAHPGEPNRDDPATEGVPPPEGYVVVKGFSPIRGWPAKIRRDDGVSTFDYFADGIYLPTDFEPDGQGGNPELVDGWPRVIVRKADPTQARFIRIRGGLEFMMGAWDDPDAIGKRADAPAHPVILSGFYIQECEVSNGQLEEFYANNIARTRPPRWEVSFEDLKTRYKQGARVHPAVYISRKEAVAYAKSLGGLLPTEAQWEYAARSLGERRLYTWGNAPDPSRDMANIDSQQAGGVTTTPSRAFRGRDETLQHVHDMAGNVREWCRDAYRPYQSKAHAERNPFFAGGNEDDIRYAVRGASWAWPPEYAASTRRDDWHAEAEETNDLGFRVVIECPDFSPRP